MPPKTRFPLLRYPGSKSKRAALLASLLPVSYDEYREPFVGSGALLPYIPADVKRWINDLSPDVAGFFRFLRAEPHAVQRINKMVRKLAHNPAALRAAFARAKRRFGAYESTALDFLLLTRHAACAIVSHHRKDICSVQPHAKNGIHVCSPERVRYWRKLVEKVKITRWDYEKVLLAPGDNVVAFLDPPYILNDHNSWVYEYSWSLSDHERLFQVLKECPHRFLMTLHRSLWSMTLYQRRDFRTPFRARRRGFRVTSQGYDYSLQGHKTAARELIISNYD